MKGIKVSKLIAIVFATVAALLLSAFAVACVDTTPSPATPTKLVLDYSDVKVDYEYDEPFTYAGLKVAVEMSDGTKQDVTTGYKVTPPEMTPGQHMVTVTYGSLSAKYAVYVEDIIKTFDDAEMFTVNGEGVYVIEAENIDLGKCTAEPCDETVGFIGKTRSVFVSEMTYLQNLGVKGNCVGAAFYAQGEYDGVILAVNVGNMTDEDIVLSDAVAMYFGFVGGDDMGELDLTDMTLKANSWQTLVFDNLTVSSYGNVIIEFIDDADIVWDSARIIVGSNGIDIDSTVNLSVASEEPVTLEVENMNTEKLVTTESAAYANSLKFGQPNLKDGDTDVSGKYVSDLETGTVVSSYIYADGDMNVNFKLNADIPADYDVASSWRFTVDGYVFDGAKASSAGWTEVELGTVGLKEGKHLFVAELIGQACDIDNFVFATSQFTVDDGKFLVEDMPENDAVIYNYASYRIEAEDLLDKSEWIHSWGEGNPIEYDPGKSMIDDWKWNKNGSSGMGVTRIKRGSVFKINTTVKTRSQIVFEIRARRFQNGIIFMPDWSLEVKIGDNKLCWLSVDDFRHENDEAADMPWGVLRCNPVTLGAGDYVIEVNVPIDDNLSFDWFEITAYDPTVAISDVDITEFGSYKVEAEDLIDRTGWSYGENGIIDSWKWNKDDSSGMCVTRIAGGFVFKVNMSLKPHSQIVLKIRVRRWQHNVVYMPGWSVNGKIGDINLSWWSGDDFRHENNEVADMPWGVLRSDPVTLDAGNHVIELRVDNDNMSFDWFEIEAYDPSATFSDAEITEFGSYRVEAETLIDRTGWLYHDNRDSKEAMLEKWNWNKDGSSGMGVTAIKQGSVFKVKTALKMRSQIVFKIRIRRWGNQQVNLEPWMLNVKIGDTDLSWWSGDDFTHSSNDSADMPWGVLRCDPVTLDAGSHVIEVNVPHDNNLSFDWFEIAAYDPSATFSDVDITEFGSYRVEAENLIDRTGWWQDGGYGALGKWTRDELSGVCITRLQNGSRVVLSFTLDEKSVVKISTAIGKWGYSNTAFDPNWMREAKIGEMNLNFTGKDGTSFKDESDGGSINYYGICESESVTLEAGRYEFTWITDDVNYDYFILDVSAPEA